jgi:hypothetical protein
MSARSALFSFPFFVVRVSNRLSLLALNFAFPGLYGGRLRRHALRSTTTFGSGPHSLFLGIPWVSRAFTKPRLFVYTKTCSLFSMDPHGLWCSPTPSSPSTEESLSMDPRGLWSSQLLPSKDPRGLWSSQLLPSRDTRGLWSRHLSHPPPCRALAVSGASEFIESRARLQEEVPAVLPWMPWVCRIAVHLSRVGDDALDVRSCAATL